MLESFDKQIMDSKKQHKFSKWITQSQDPIYIGSRILCYDPNKFKLNRNSEYKIGPANIIIQIIVLQQCK